VTLALATAAGFLAGRLGWLLLRPAFAHPSVQRENYRGHVLPTAAGLVLPFALVVVEAGRTIAGAAGVGDEEYLGGARVAVVLLVPALALFGLADDLLGTSGDRGFRGHLAALARGRLTTGGAKLLGGAAASLVAVSIVAGEPAVARLLADGALVALAANLGNLFDRAPGRTVKVGIAAAVVLAVVTGAPTELAGVAVVVGAGAALLLDDMHERLMLGDTGANALGGALGLGVVIACAPGTRDVVLLALIAANISSEVVSFSRIIDAVPPLRALDRWGRP
jgi:UDP-N-acetylmuramyl pentapeptide phosphotransferase/UDP-N-acetylglucosamine-1-phosphate transferase